MGKRSTSIIGGNAGRNRSHNRRVVLDFVRAHEPAGRAEIARSCGLSVQAVSNIIGSLEHEGLLLADGHRIGGRGNRRGKAGIRRIQPKGRANGSRADGNRQERIRRNRRRR